MVGEGAWGGLWMGKSCTVSTCGPVQSDSGGGLSGCRERRKGGGGSFLPVGCFLAYPNSPFCSSRQATNGGRKNKKNERASKEGTRDNRKGGGGKSRTKAKVSGGNNDNKKNRKKGTLQAKEGQKENNLHKKKITLHLYIYIYFL